MFGTASSLSAIEGQDLPSMMALKIMHVWYCGTDKQPSGSVVNNIGVWLANKDLVGSPATLHKSGLGLSMTLIKDKILTVETAVRIRYDKGMFVCLAAEGGGRRWCLAKIGEQYCLRYGREYPLGACFFHLYCFRSGSPIHIAKCPDQALSPKSYWL